MNVQKTSKLTSSKRADRVQLRHLSVKDICRVYARSLEYFKTCDYDMKKLKQNQQCYFLLLYKLSHINGNFPNI